MFDANQIIYQGINMKIKTPVKFLAVLLGIFLISSIQAGLSTNPMNNEWQDFTLRDTNNKTLSVFFYTADHEEIPIEVELNVTELHNASLILKTYQTSIHNLDLVYYTEVGNYSYSNSTTLLGFDLQIPNTDTEYYIEHNSSVRFQYRLKSSSNALPAEVELNVWKEVRLNSLGPSILKVFNSDNEHNITINVQLTKIENGSFSVAHFKSDTGLSAPINDYLNHSLNFVGHYVSLNLESNTTTGLIEGRYQLIDNGYVGPVIPAFEVWVLLVILSSIYIKKRI